MGKPKKPNQSSKYQNFLSDHMQNHPNKSNSPQSPPQSTLQYLLKDLQELKEKYRAITDHSAVGIMIVQKNHIVYVNQWLADLLEVNRNDMMTWDMSQANKHVHPQDLDKIKRYYQEQFPNVEFRLVSASEKIYWVIQSSNEIRYQGKPAEQVFIINISEKKRIEQSLINSEEKFRRIFEESPIGILTADPNGNILSANEKLVAILGSPSVKATKSINLLTLPNLQTTGFSAKFRKCVEKNVEINEEIVYLSKWGKKLYLQYKLVPLENENGRISEILCNVNDITHIKKAQDELRAKDRRFRQMVELAPYPIAVLTLDGKVEYVNQNIKNLFGDRDYRQHNLQKVLPYLRFNENSNPPSFTYLQRLWKKALKKLAQENYRHEFQVQPPKKDPVDVKVTLTLIEDRVFIIFENITERKVLEQEKLRMQKVESLSVLAGGIAHDFNNILVGIIGNISLLQMADNLDEDTRDTLQELKKATSRAKGLTNQLLTFAKGGKPVKKPANVVKIMKETLQLVFPGSQCTYSLENDDNLPPVNVDSSQIQQVFNNILINAIQAMPNPGEIKVSIQKVSTPLHKSVPTQLNGYIVIAIKDQGNGIAPEVEDHLFDPYYTTKKSGSGLGLASSYSIIKKHDGYITYDTELGTGTTFYVYLPVSLFDLAIEEEEITIDQQFDKKVLIMDDDLTVSKTLQKMLTQLGIQAKIVPDGEQAIVEYSEAQVHGVPYDLVFMDLTIPGGMGGKETIQHLQQFDPNIKALVSSGYSQDPIMSNFKKFGFFDVLLKPYTMKKLQEKLSSVFN